LNSADGHSWRGSLELPQRERHVGGLRHASQPFSSGARDVLVERCSWPHPIVGEGLAARSHASAATPSRAVPCLGPIWGCARRPDCSWPTNRCLTATTTPSRAVVRKLECYSTTQAGPR